jgi:hypothetical protein
LIWDDKFTTVPAAPRYVVEKALAARPFSILEGGGLRVKYVATKECPRAEAQPRTDPDNKVGIRLPKGQVLSFSTAIRVNSEVQKNKSVLMQWYQVMKGNPPLSLELLGSELKLVRLWYEKPWPGYNPNRETVWRYSIARRVWYELGFEIEFSSAPNTGSVRVDIDGHGFYIPGPNCYGDDLGILPKLGIYRPGVKEGTVPLGQTTSVDYAHWKIW